ncbi:MAG TPA: hypothetical protein DEP42_06775 [Ruminococcaceae bacterium]|nr:hypothetical protein [Oscillospiraceae bacterium]
MNEGTGTGDWVAIAYKLPAHPSKYRVYVWRKLKQAGAICYQQSIVILPMNMWNRTFLEGLCKEIRIRGGEAAILQVNLLEQQEERRLIDQFNQNMQEACQEISRSLLEVLDNAKQFPRLAQLKHRQEVSLAVKARKSYEKYKRHGFFQAPLDQEIGRMVESLLTKIENYLHSYDLVK